MHQDRKHYIKITLLAYAIWIVMFEAVGRYAAMLPTRDLTTFLDRQIPLIPEFIWPYELCYVFPFLPLFVIKDFHRFNRTLLSIIFANLSAFILYLTFPIAFPRPELGQSLSEKILYLEYASDFYPGANKLPSLHVTFAWLVYFACRKQRLSKAGDAIVLLTAMLITLSTMFVKQHIILDVVAGVLWAFAAWGTANYFYPLLADPQEPAPLALKKMLKRTAVLVIYLIVFWVALPGLLWWIGKTADRFWPINLPTLPALITTGVALIIAGLALLILSIKHLISRGSGLPISHLPPSEFVSTGPYRYSRHPIYIGYTALWAGMALAISSFWMLTISLTILVSSWLLYVFLYEEPILLKRFGKKYEIYRDRTPIVPIKGSR
jgi:protein-S-isoprenylcysteine O-methyltransferase Ste14